MFGLFQSRPPLATSQRVDLQWLMRRSRETFGDDFFHRYPVILSVDEIEIDASSIDNKIQSIANALSQRFGTDLDPLQWRVSTAENPVQPVVYQHSDNQNSTVTINATVDMDDLQVIMLVANALARHAWQGRRQRDLDVDPQTTSLLPIIVGLGVLASQSSLLDNQWSTVGWSGWSLSRSGYYNTMEIGYAMAIVDRVVNSDSSKPKWLPALRLDSRSVCKRAIHSFKRTDNAGEPLLFDANRIPNQKSSPPELAVWLAGDDVNFALAAAIVACNSESDSNLIIDAALKATERSDVELTARATQVLGHASSDRADVKAKLIKLSNHRSPLITFSAMSSATKVGMPHHDFVSSAKRLLGAESFDLIPVLDWIASGGKQCVVLEPILMEHLEDAKRSNHEKAIQSLTNCIGQLQSG